MKTLIINGDDFGASHGINRGVVEAHQKGVLTSASMMVNGQGSSEAARLAKGLPDLGVGLHVVLPPTTRAGLEAEVEGQIESFIELTGKLPTHLDSHRNVHQDPDVLPVFLAVADRNRLPLRGHCGVQHIGRFYGQWNGESHLEQISPEALGRILAADVVDGVNELCCHPGYADGDLASSYSYERETELDTLCDPEITQLVREQSIRLVTFRRVLDP
jgi:chitin disaccharide deacetylase